MLIKPVCVEIEGMLNSWADISTFWNICYIIRLLSREFQII